MAKLEWSKYMEEILQVNEKCQELVTNCNSLYHNGDISAFRWLPQCKEFKMQDDTGEQSHQGNST